MSDPQTEKQLHDLVSAFLAENEKLNLSAFRKEENCWTGNVLDSLALLDVPSLPQFQTLLDLGTGGGFPLLPLAIARPDATFVGLDSVRKKVDAVGRIIEKMALKNVRCACGRAEEFGRLPAYRETFDVVTSRAVGGLSTLLEYMSPFTKLGGRIVIWKSLKIEEELKDALLAQKALHCPLIKQYTYELPDGFGARQLLIFQKAEPVSNKYPRPVGVPKKDPVK